MSDERISSASEIARAIRARELGAAEVLDACLARIDEVNPTVNAIVTLEADRSRQAAERADRDADQGKLWGPLHGVPFTVKDLIATEGIRTTAGSVLLADFIPTFTAPAVRRLERAGAILLGKTNCPEFGLDLHTHNDIFGDTKNPWFPQVTPGGSSGGDSAAVAGGFVPFSVGTDLGGSIRWPAHCTGTVSFRATPGLIPGTGQLPLRQSPTTPPPTEMSMQGRLQVISPIANCVDDLWLLVRLMAGPDHLDPRAVPVALGDPSTVSVGDLRCAWFDGADWLPIRRDLAEVVQEAAGALGTAGASVVRDYPKSMVDSVELFTKLRLGDGQSEIRDLALGREADLSDRTKTFLAATVDLSFADYSALLAASALLRTEVLRFMEAFPILLWPVASGPAFEVDTRTVSIDGTGMAIDELINPCRAISVLGLPVATVPCGSSLEGRPVAVQVVGRPYADHEVIAVAGVLESVFGPWHAAGG